MAHVGVNLRGALGAFSILVLVAGLAHAARSDEPSALDLFPKTTLACISVPNVPEMKERLAQSAYGQMSQDSDLKPLVDKLYGNLAAALAGVEERIGLSLGELAALPKGEVSIGVASAEQGPPVVMALLVAGDQISSVDKLLESSARSLEDAGATRSEEAVEADSLVTFALPGNNSRQVAYVRREGAVLLATNVAVLKSMLERWNGAGGESLSDNPNFSAIHQRCQAPKGETAHLTWFVDPINLFKNLGQNNPGARIALAFLPRLGLDGLQGIGGSLTVATEHYDMLTHVHLLLESPRSGVLELLALTSGETAPPPWVPAEVASYATLNWDIDTTYKALTTLFDSIRGKGNFAAQVKSRLNEPSGIDFEKDVLSALEGRFVMATWIEKPATITSTGQLFGIRLNDAEEFQPTLAKLVTKFQANIAKRDYGGSTFYEVTGTGPTGGSEPSENPRRASFGILGDDFIFTDRPSLYEQAIIAQSDSSKSLTEALDYKLVASRIARQTGSRKPGMLSFSRPEEGLRFYYDLLTSDATREQLRARPGPAGLFSNLNDALEQHPLPPFAVLEQYLAPAGAWLSNDETGFHYTSFSLRRKQD